MEVEMDIFEPSVIGYIVNKKKRIYFIAYTNCFDDVYIIKEIYNIIPGQHHLWKRIIYRKYEEE